MKRITIAAVAALSFTFAGCGDTAKKADDTKTAAKDQKKDGGDAKDDGAEKKDAEKKDGGEAAAEADPVKLLTASIDAWNEGDLEGAAASFADDIAFEMPGGPPASTGKEPILKAWEQSRTAFPDMKVAIKRVVLTGDTVAMHLVSHGTHKGEYHGQAPTDKEVGADILYVMTQKDGKFSNVTAYANPMAYMTQIGAAPEGVESVPLPAMPEGDPEIIKGEPNEANVEVVKAWYAAWADGSVVDKLDTFLAADSKHYQVTEGKVDEGLESAKKDIPEIFKAVSDIHIDDATYASAGDWVLVTGKWSGKHTGDMGPIKATNKEFSVQFTELNLVKDGKLVESWEYNNPMQMMMQLGLVPEPGAAPTEEAVAAK
jgi:steroid delta-isomerase-like uncharacterized protein